MSRVSVSDLIDAHSEALYRYAFRLSGSAANAEDLTQDTFTRAIQRLSQLREPDKARGWLFRILRNEYLHRVRDEKRQRLMPLDAVGEVAAAEPPESGLPAVEPGAVQAALDDLDETFRTPLILFYFEDFSYREIAEQMDLPIGTVMSRLARGKGYLKTKLFPGHRDL